MRDCSLHASRSKTRLSLTRFVSPCAVVLVSITFMLKPTSIKICHETKPISIALIRADNPGIGDNKIATIQVRRYEDEDDDEAHGFTHWIQLCAKTDDTEGYVSMIYNYHPRNGWSFDRRAYHA